MEYLPIEPEYFLSVHQHSPLHRERHWDLEDVKNHVNKLQEKLLVKSLEQGAFTRIEKNRVQVVKAMPTIVKSRQPTIAIITAQYCEKLAVDAMIDDKVRGWF